MSHAGKILDEAVRRFRSLPWRPSYIEVRHDGVHRVLFILRHKQPGDRPIKLLIGSADVWIIVTSNWKYAAREIFRELHQKVWNS